MAPFYFAVKNARNERPLEPSDGPRFLALRLEVDLQQRLDENGIETSWPDLMRDLKQLQAVRMNLDGKSYLIRTDFEGVAYQAFKAAGVQPPKRVLAYSAT
jgi:hypothetical protein